MNDQPANTSPKRSLTIVGVVVLLLSVIAIMFNGSHNEIKQAPDQYKGVFVLSATYGKNCGIAEGNVTDVISKACNGITECAYTLQTKVLGDPAHGCRKDFIAKWHCNGEKSPRTLTLDGEAGNGSEAKLSCPK